MNASAQTLFFSELSKLKRRIVIGAFHRILLNACLIFLCICIFVFIIQKAGFSNLSVPVSWYILPIGFSLAVALLLGFLKRKKLINILIDIDRRLRLQDRISTAYEHQKFGKKTAFSDLQLQDAAAKLHQFSTKQMLPAKFSWLHLLLIFLIIANLSLFWSGYLSPDHKPVHVDQDKLEVVKASLRNYAISPLENKKEKKKRRQNVYLKKLEHLRNRLSDRSITRDQLIATLDRLLKDVQGEQTRLATELGAKLNAAKIDEMPIQTIPKLEKLSMSQLENLKMLLNRTLNNQIPDSIDQNIETLQDLYRMEKLLSKIMDDFNDGHLYSEEVSESKRDDTQTSTPTNGFKKPYDDTKHSKIRGEFSNRNRGNEVSHGQPGPEQSQESGRDLKDEFGLHQGSSPSAGSTPSAGKKKSRDELEKSPGLGSHDKMISSQANNYLIHIRSLTTIGKSRLKEEDIIRSYRQEIEGVLQKEDIPLNYREYIKHYFISIGLKAEKNANGLK